MPWWRTGCYQGLLNSSRSQQQRALGDSEPWGLGRHSPEKIVMGCNKGCSMSGTKWALVGSVSVVLVIALGLVLSFTLQQQQHNQPGRGLPVMPSGWLPIHCSDGLLSHPASPLRP